MKLKHRILSLVLALSLAISCTVTAAWASGFNPVVDTITSSADSRVTSMINALQYQSFSSPSREKVQNYIRYFINTSKYAAIGGEAWPYTNENGYVSTVTDGTYTISGINGSGCFAYAKWVMNVIYGTTGSALSEGESAGAMTASHMESFLRTNAQAGEQLRLGNVHSVTFISCTGSGFYYMDYWGGYIRLHYTTFTAWTNACNNYGSGNVLKLYNANTNTNDASAQKSNSPGETGGVAELTISPVSYPSGQLTMGTSFNLTGSVDTSSGNTITSFTGTLYRSDGTVVTGPITTTPNSQSVDIRSSKINSSISFGELSAGDYYLEYSAKDSSGDSVIWTSDIFTVVDSVSTLQISPTAYPSGKLLASSFDLEGTVTSNYNIKTVSGYIYNTEGDIIYSSLVSNVNATEFDFANSNIDNALKFGSLTPGTYYLQYEAADASGKAALWISPTFTIVSTASELTDNSSVNTGEVKISCSPAPSGNLTKGHAFSFSGSISSSYNIVSADCTIHYADGRSTSQSFTTFPGTSYVKLSTFNGKMNFSQLESGYYYMQITARDASDSVGVWKSPIFAVSDKYMFTDVEESSWYYSQVYAMASRGFVSGMTVDTFCPSNQLTRAQVVVMLYAISGKPAVSGAMPFTDCPDSWYQNAVIWAKESGLVSGTSPTTFDPGKYITRQEMAIILKNFCVKFCGASASSGDMLSGYEDASSADSWAVDALNWCICNGLISSTSTEAKIANPLGTSTRAQSAVQLNNIINKYSL